MTPARGGCSSWPPCSLPRRSWPSCLTFPFAAQMTHVGRVDNFDGDFGIWNVSWVARTLIVDPAHVLDANIFYPHQRTLVYSETNLGAGALAIPAYWATRNPYFTFNFAFILSMVLARHGRLLPGPVSRARSARGGGFGDRFCLLRLRLCPHAANAAADDGRPAVQHACVPPGRRSADCRAGRRARTGDGRAGRVLRVLRGLRDADGGIRDVRACRHAPVVDDRRLLEGDRDRGSGRRGRRAAGARPVHATAADDRLRTRAGRGKAILRGLAGLPGVVRAGPSLDAEGHRTLERGAVPRVRRDDLRPGGADYRVAKQ